MRKTIYSPNSAYGGYEYRVTSDGKIVRIQERKGGCAAFKTKRTLTPAQWEQIRDDNFDAYTNDPAVLSRLCAEGSGDLCF